MSELFQISRTNVVEHIKHIYEEGELEEDSTCRNFRQVREEGNRTVSRMMPFYNLDMIISLGYRVKSRVSQTDQGSSLHWQMLRRRPDSDLCRRQRMVSGMGKESYRDDTWYSDQHPGKCKALAWCSRG